MTQESSKVHVPWQSVYDELGVVAPALDDRPLGHFVEQHARNFPDTIALRYFDQTVTYRQLNREANQLAHALVKLGVTHGDVVGLHMPNIPQYMVAILAITKIGAAGSGVSTLLSPLELEHQITDADLNVLITLDSLSDRISGETLHKTGKLKSVVVVSATHESPSLPVIEGVACYDYQQLIVSESHHFDQRQVSGEDTMMVQYTGGTTGPPKGAKLSVRCLMSNVVQSNVYQPWVTSKELLITGYPMSHGAGLAYAITTVRFAATMVLIPNPRDIEYLCQQMFLYPPTRIAAVPSLFQLLLACDTFHTIDFSKLKVANTGAAPMTTELQNAVEAVIGEGKLCERFGMTETGPAHLSSPASRGKPGSVGIPIPLADTRIVDLETGTKEMPFGEPGEIITSGPQVMTGYLNLPEQTAMALRSWRGKTWMYTGDVGFMDEEGYVTLCDRAKDMLIVGGYKVFSVEIEDKLSSLPILAGSAVVGIPDQARPGNEIVTLYVALEEDARNMSVTDVEDQILTFCRDTMAPYKVPKQVHILDQIPLTTVGKIDKKLLRSNAVGL